MAAQLWSVTSYKALREDALDAERWSRLHPDEPARTPYLTEALSASEGPVVAAVLKALADTGDGKVEEVADAIVSYGIDAEALPPRVA